MRRLPKRKGISLGTVTMLLVTGLVVLSCFWLFPRLLGDTDFHFDAKELAVAFDRSYANFVIGLDSEPISTPAQTEQPPEQQAPQFTPVSTPTEISFRLTAAGSVRIDNAIQKAVTDDMGYHFADLFAHLRDEMGADLSIVTLENTVISTEKLTDTNLPTDALAALGACGFRAVCLGYPGALTSGISGLSSTQNAAHDAGMIPYGVYASQEQRDALTFTEINGLSVALLSYQSELSSTSKKKATKEEQAFAIAPPTLESIAEDIRRARASGAQVVLVSLCWGKDGATSPTKAQRELAQSIADAGADIILGTRSGTVQAVEVLTANRASGRPSQTLCAYSLGNLLSNNRNKRANISGILLHANLTYDLTDNTVSFNQLSYTPTYVWKGKKADKTAYAVIPSDRTPPDEVQGDQLSVMNRSLELIQDVFKGSALTQRTPGAVFEVSGEEP